MFESIKNLFSEEVNEPIFLSISDNQQKKLDKLKKSNTIDEHTQKEIKLLEAGIFGENQIIYELRNSHVPMAVIHDLNIDYKGYKAQIDFLIVTKQRVFVLECKNLYGDIEIDSNGNFIRTMKFNGSSIKEGIYSPITQNQRHLELIQMIRLDHSLNKLHKKFLAGSLDNLFVSKVVLANSKTVLKMKYAKKEIKDKIIRVDQLNELLKNDMKSNNGFCFKQEDMISFAEVFMKHHVEKTSENEHNEENGNKEKLKSEVQIEDFELSTLYLALKEYRLKKCREDNIKAYYIFNNEQLKELVINEPKSIDELLKINGFSEVKCSKYGEDIIELVKQNSK